MPLAMSAQTSHLPLNRKTAIVTGASRGIGAGLAYDLAQRGAEVVIIYTSEKSSGLVEDLINKIALLPHQPRTFSVRADLSQADSPASIISAIQKWVESTGRELKIDILVNNAAVELNRRLGDITPADFAHVYDLNVRGTLLMTQAVLPHLVPKGRIVNISSVGSRAGFASLGLYCSSKAAIEGLTRVWAAELGANGTTVNAVNPGPVQSEMLEKIPKDIVEGQKKSTPVEQRLGTIDDVAQVVGWLASEESRWITGQVISASGGWAMY